MGLLKDKVKELILAKKPKKWEILKECCEDDIKEMIKAGIPIRKQLKIIQGAQVVDKLSLSEYYKIIKNHFGYAGRAPKVRVFECNKNSKSNNDVVSYNNKSSDLMIKNNRSKRVDVKEALKRDINILSVAGIDIDGAMEVIKKN